MPALHVLKEDGVLALQPRGHSDRLRNMIYRAVPAAQWNKTRNRWEAPPTYGTALSLVHSLPAIRTHCMIDVRVNEPAALLLEAARNLQRPPDSDEPIPLNAPTEPWRHQRMAWWYLRWARLHLGCALLDCGMRTGKTRMVLDHLQTLPREQRRGLVLCPKSVVPVWVDQARRHCEPGRLHVVAPDPRWSVAERVRYTVALLADDNTNVVVLGWSVLASTTLAQKKVLRGVLRDATVVADEVHYAKAPGSRRSQALAMISEHAAMRIGASGTPLAHSPLDAYGVFRFLDRGVWGTSFTRFRDRYAVMGGFGGHQVLSYRNLEELASRMRPYTFKATRDVLDLPPSQDIEIKIDIGPSAMRVYRDLRDECVAELRSGTLTVEHALSRLVRLAEVASGYLPAADGSGSKEVLHEEKVGALVDLFESSDPGEPWVAFGRFTHDVASVQQAAKRAGRPFFQLTGRANELDEWKRCRERGPVLGAQIQAGGIGVDMTEAALCAYVSVGYSLTEYEQSRARIHGPDQKRPVAYYHLVATGTVDVAIRKALARRADVLRFVTDQLVHGEGQE